MSAKSVTPLVRTTSNVTPAHARQGPCASAAPDTIAALQQWLAWNPSAIAQWMQLGREFAAAGRFHESATAFAHASRLAPGNLDARLGLAHALSEQGCFADAAQTCLEAMDDTDESLPLHYALVIILARAGMYTQAWEKLQAAHYRDSRPVQHGLLALAYLRYRQHDLPAALAAVEELLEQASDHAGAQKLHAELLVAAGRMSFLPQYHAVHPTPAQLQRWRDALAPWQNMRIGLVWADDSPQGDAMLRSLPLSAFSALAAVPGLTFFNLQSGSASREAGSPPEGLAFVTLPQAPDTLEDTVALLAQMDLVLCVDCDMAHHAAQAGCRTWIMLPEHARAQWMRERSDVPCYPTARLFRQSRCGDWTPVLAEVELALLDLLGEKAFLDRLDPTQRTLREAAVAAAGFRHADADRLYARLLAEDTEITRELIAALHRHIARVPQHRLLDAIEARCHRLSPEAAFWLDDLMACVLHQQGESEFAFGIWSRLIIRGIPALPVYLHLAQALHKDKLYERAICVWEKAFAIFPDAARLYELAAETYRAHDDLIRLLNCLQRAAEIAPLSANSHILLGVRLRAREAFADARRHIQAGVVLDPQVQYGWENLGYQYEKEKKFHAAKLCYLQALELSASAYSNERLSVCLIELGEFEAAIEHAQQAIAVKGQSKDALVSRAFAMRNLGRYTEAIPLYNELIAAKLHNEEEMKGLYLHLFGMVRWESDHERVIEIAKCWTKKLALTMPEWRGEPLEGKTLLVYQSNGFGDSIQYSRLLRLLNAKRIIYLAWPSLYRLVRGVEGVHEVYKITAVDLEAMQCDYQIGDWHVYFRLKGDYAVNPVPVPYLKADKSAEQYWRNRLAEDTHFRIGIAWSGNAKHSMNRHRSTTLADWLPLADVPGISLYCLQQNDDATSILDVPELRLRNTAVECKDFADTAALMSSLDLVISVDTAPVHLAGALGRPAWVLLPNLGLDARWGETGDDCPWYPTLRLFRKARGESWRDVLLRVREALLQHLRDG